jgi:diguanylate cyclase (GGDEF)-like protein/PAS domain S-box-containing protein
VLRVSCLRARGGKSRRRVGYELPLPEWICHAFIRNVGKDNFYKGLGGWGMVGQDADRGNSRVEREADRRRVWGADRRDLEAGSLANWSRALDDQRRELLAGVGHELKTPLSIVLGLCGRLLAADELEAGQTRDVERIRANAYVLLKRVDELLQVSRLDAGHLAIEPRDVDVAALIRSSCEGFASVAEMRGQRLVLEAPVHLRAYVDEEKVLSVVSNLLANALKHAPEGGVVRCSVAAPDGRLRIEVADDGPGVAVGQRREIFERYRQGPGSASRPAGSGLGLAIVRELVTLHHGRVTIADAPEGGALFVVDLPLASPAPGDADAPSPPTIDVAERQRATVERLRADLEAESRRGTGSGAAAPGDDRASVLVVTADSELGAFVQELVADGYRVHHAADAVQAARVIADRSPDAVVLDAAAGDGAMAALGRRLGRTPLVTLAAAREDVPALIRAGAQDCVVKPFDSDELRARLDALVERGRAAERTAADLAGLDRAFHAAPMPMALISTEGRIVRVNRELSSLLGFTARSLLQRTVEELIHPADLPRDDQRRSEGRRLIVDRGTWRLVRADGSYVRVRAATSLVDESAGADGCLLWHLSEVGEEQHPEGGAGVLVGMPGRRAFERAVRHQLLRCRRYGEQAALVRCSLDGLPDVRTADGPDVADRLIAAIVEAVRRRLRSTDVVAYVGDHEIAALLAHADLDAATTTADAIREAAEDQRVVTPRGYVATSAEVGVASLSRAGSPGRAFLEAGLALQAAEPSAASLGRFRRPQPSEDVDDVSLGRPS